MKSIFKTSSDTTVATFDDDLQTFVEDSYSHNERTKFDQKKEMEMVQVFSREYVTSVT